MTTDDPGSVRRAIIASPVGLIALVEIDSRLVSLEIRLAGVVEPPANAEPRTPLLVEAKAQLEAYFHFGLRNFDLPLAPSGTGFQERVWGALREIPYGETRSYADLAHRLGSVARAVGQACGANPIPIVIPCHRVLAEDGRLGGFSAPGGRETKYFLLELEGAKPARLF